MLEVGIKGQRETVVTKEKTATGIGSGLLEVFATPVGMKVVAKSELIKIDGRELTFNVEAYDEKGLIGEGVHKRFIVNNDKFQAKTDSKLEK